MNAVPGTVAPRGPLLIDVHGNPLKPKASTAHQAADRFSQELAAWVPFLGSADADWLPERDTVVARIHDLANNDGWASAAVQKQVDAVVGSMFTLQAQPDWEALGQTKEWADEWAKGVESRWRNYAEDPDFWCDASRHGTMVSNFALMFRHRFLDGEALGLLLWLPERRGQYATTLQVVDPDRLSNPQSRPDEEFLRGGVELGPHGEPLAAHIRKTHPGDVLGFGRNSFEWERVPFETEFGRRVVIHDFDRLRAGQTRGKSVLTPIVKKIKQLGRYDEAELGAAIINAIFAAFIQSPFDHDMLSQALETESLGKYQDGRQAFHEDSRLRLGGIRIPQLYPGEDFKMNAVARPSSTYTPFTTTAGRNIASAAGLSYEQLAMDFSNTNYSSMRGALNEVHKYCLARRGGFSDGSARQVYAAWLEEDIDQGNTEIPPGAPDFHEAKGAYTRSSWTGPGRGMIDAVRESQGAVLRMTAGLSTLQKECADLGLDWREVLEQRAREIDLMKELGIPPMEWTAVMAMAREDTPERNQQSGG